MILLSLTAVTKYLTKLCQQYSSVSGGFVDTLFDLNVPNWFLDPQLHCVLFDVTAFKAWPTEEDDYGIAIILKDLHYVETVGIYYHYGEIPNSCSTIGFCVFCMLKTVTVLNPGEEGIKKNH